MIGMRAFNLCSGITDINVGYGNPTYSSIDGILYDKEQRVLIQCPGGKVGEITIPDSVTSFGSRAFGGCSGLTGTLTIPDRVTAIGDIAFYSCSGLTGLTIGNGVTSIGLDSFYGCSNITTLTS